MFQYAPPTWYCTSWVPWIRYILENDSDHWRSRQLVAASTSAGYGLPLDDIERELTTS
jgi:hypothetical protein